MLMLPALNSIKNVVSRLMRGTAVLALMGAGTASLAQQSLTYDPGLPGGADINPGDNSWNNTGTPLIWNDGGAAVAFSDNEDVIFDTGIAPGTYTVTVDGTVSAGDIAFNTDGFTLGGGTIDSGSLTTTITGSGDALINTALSGDFVLDGTQTLTYGGMSDALNTITINTATLTNTGTLSNGTTQSSTITNTGGVFINTGTADNYTQTFGSSELAGTFNGDVTLDAGSTDITGDVTITGTLDASIDVVIDNDVTANNVVSSGDVTIDSGATVGITGVGEVFDNSAGTLTVLGSISGDVQNSGVADVDGSIIGDVTNDGTMTLAGRITGNVDTNNDLTVDGASAISGTLDTSGQVTVEQNLTVGGLTTVESGTLDVEARLNGDVQVDATGTLDVDNAIIGDVTNDGTMTLAGNINGNVDTNNDLTVDGVSRITGTLDTSGQVTVEQNLTVGGLTTVESGTLDVEARLNSDVQVDATGTLDVDSSLAGDVTNDGMMTLAGTIVGNVDTNNDLTVDGVSRITGALDTSGQATVEQALTVNGLTTVESGMLDVEALLSGDVQVDATGTLDVDNAVTGDVTNDGILTLAGDITGNLTNTLNLTVDGLSSVTGDLNNSSTLTAQADVQWGTLSNDGVFAIENGIAAGATSGLLTNTGTITMADGSMINSALLNNGTVSVDGSAQLNDGLSGSGIVDLQDGAVDDTLTINGPVTSSGLTFNLDVDLTEGATTSDSVVISGGPLTGDVALSFSEIGGVAGNLGAAVTVLSYNLSEMNDFTLSTSGLGVSGTTLYFLDENTALGELNLLSVTDPNLGGLAGAVVLTQSLISSVVNRPSSPYVVGTAIPGDEDCGPGVWGRQTLGEATIDSDIVSTSSNGETTISSELSATYRGFQLGADVTCRGENLNGWELSYGGILGYNDGSTVQPVFGFNALGEVDPTSVLSTNTTDFAQFYGGGYVSAFNDGLLLDLQYRLEGVDFDLENNGTTAPSRAGIVDQSFSSQSQTFGGTASYQFSLNEEMRLNLVPIAGFSVTDTSVDTIQTEDGPLEISDFTSKIGFVGATLSRTVIDPSGDYASTYFGTMTYYEDYSDEIESTLPGSTITTPTLGQFTELSLGFNYIQLLDGGAYAGARQLSASVRVDGKVSDSLESWGVTGQLRINF